MCMRYMYVCMWLSVYISIHPSMHSSIHTHIHTCTLHTGIGPEFQVMQTPVTVTLNTKCMWENMVSLAYSVPERVIYTKRICYLDVLNLDIEVILEAKSKVSFCS